MTATENIPGYQVTEAPAWFTDAINTPHEDTFTEIDGVPVHYLAWGERGKPGLIFVHGNGAHARWFQFIAPLLADEFRVASLDLSGMGDSKWRGKYVRETFARDIWGVCEAAGLGPKPIIAGHSFGGLVSLVAAGLHSHEMAGLVILDFAVRPPERHSEWFEFKPPAKPTRVYPTLEKALSRFRLAPEQPCENQFIIDFIARHSLREVEGGWTWKFDHKTYDNLILGLDLPDILSHLSCPAALIYGLRSKSFEAMDADYMRTLMGPDAYIKGMDTEHHIMLDQPLGLAEEMRELARRFHAVA